jgi:putative oxidoreductase
MAIVTLGRIIFGAYFLYSGFNHFKDEKMLTGYAKSKGVPSPRLAVLVTGAMMIVGGLGFILNSYTPQCAILLLIFLVPTTLMMHSFWKIHDPMHKMNERVGFFKNLALIGALLVFSGIIFY